MIYIGIDPGASGGFAEIPDIGAPSADSVKGMTEQDVFNHLSAYKGVMGGVIAIIEKVSSRPGQGVSSTFKFGQSYGSLRMALVAAGIPFDEVTPQKWQKELGLIRSNKNETITAKKNRHKAKAQQLFPDLKITHATADALLIAEYCRRVNR